LTRKILLQFLLRRRAGRIILRFYGELQVGGPMGLPARPHSTAAQRGSTARRKPFTNRRNYEIIITGAPGSPGHRAPPVGLARGAV